jgi:hypothetical protein
MGVTKKPIYAREALLPMSFPAKSFQKNYVPFVGRTDATDDRNAPSSADPTTQEQSVAAAAKRIRLFEIGSGVA